MERGREKNDGRVFIYNFKQSLHVDEGTGKYLRKHASVLGTLGGGEEMFCFWLLQVLVPSLVMTVAFFTPEPTTASAVNIGQLFNI